MADKKIFVVTGLGYGDEGKGKTVHWLCYKHKAHTVIRTGGPQAFHRVVSSAGKEHVHAQFGSGTLAGAATHLSKNMIIDPYAIMSEGKSLKNDLNIINIFDQLTIHEDALVITPFQAIANRLRELTRGVNRRGSVGVGVGETVRDSEMHQKASIRARDLRKSYLMDKLLALRKIKLDELAEPIDMIERLPEVDRDRARLELNNLKNDNTVEWAIGWFNELASKVRIVNTDYVAKNILGRQGTVVFEGSQGILLDRWHGFHPYTTKVRTIPETALSIVNECGYGGDVTSLGVLRAYHTRHGAGPFVVESSKLTNQLPDPTNSNHPWQGNFRVGAFDIVLAKYATRVCGPNKLDGLVVTCLDRVQSIGTWDVCRSYNGPYVRHFFDFFSQNGADETVGIKIFRNQGESQLKHQEELGRLLGQCSPNITKFKIKGDAVSLCSDILNDNLDIPVFAVSTGPSEKDCIEFTSIKKGQTV